MPKLHFIKKFWLWFLSKQKQWSFTNLVVLLVAKNLRANLDFSLERSDTWQLTQCR